MCKLIQVEDATNLQRLTDLSTQIHGEVNSLYDLVLAFVECGRIRQARKILEVSFSLGLALSDFFVCKRFGGFNFGFHGQFCKPKKSIDWSKSQLIF